MSIIKRKQHNITQPIDQIIFETPDPGVSSADYYSKNIPAGLLRRAYHYENEVSIFADIVQTLTNEILRNGLEWKPLFTLECKVCGHRSDELIDTCPACESSDFREPNEAELKRFKHADGSDFFSRANGFDQSLIRVMESLEYHLEVANRGILLVTKAYVSDEYGDIIDAVPIEVQALHPLYVTPLFDHAHGRMGGNGRVCIRHEQRKLLGNDQHYCPDCGHRTYEAIFRTNMPSGPTAYYVAGEIKFVTKYGSDIFGYPAILKVEDDAWAYHHLEKRTCAYYDQGRPPGIISIPTRSMESTMSLWDKIMARCKIDPHYTPWLGFDPENRSGITFTQLMKDPNPDMLAVKDDIRRRMGSYFGVSPLWQSDVTTSGGLNNETQQLTVSNRAFARGQRIFNEDLLPWLSQQFGIKDWVLTLVPAEDADELRDEQLMSARLDNVRKALEVGLKVDWSESGYTISGTPKLQEQMNSPISIPGSLDVPEKSGEVSKSDNPTYTSFTYSPWQSDSSTDGEVMEKGCPPGEHEHPDFPYCHPEERVHRTGEGGERESANEGAAEEESSDSPDVDAAETTAELEDAVKKALNERIPGLKLDLTLGDVETCRTSMKRFIELANDYETKCKEISVIPMKSSLVYAGTLRGGSKMYLNTTHFAANPGSARSGSKRAEGDIKRGAANGYNPPIREGEEVESIITHEFGHTLLDPDFSDSIEGIWKDYSERFPEGVIKKDDPDFVSGYAAKDKGEFISECLVSAMHTDKPSTTAKEIMDKINQYFKRRAQ